MGDGVIEWQAPLDGSSATRFFRETPLTFLKAPPSISVPLLAIENSADDAVPQPHARMIHDAAASKDKTFHLIKGATHYYAGQPELLKEAP